MTKTLSTQCDSGKKYRVNTGKTTCISLKYIYFFFFNMGAVISTGCCYLSSKCTAINSYFMQQRQQQPWGASPGAPCGSCPTRQSNTLKLKAIESHLKNYLIYEDVQEKKHTKHCQECKGLRCAGFCLHLT